MSQKPSSFNAIKKAIHGPLLDWFDQHQRAMPWRNNRTPYRVWISELMLQQTRVDQATPYFQRFMKRFPSLRSLANASQEEVLKQWEGLGYYARARNLHKAAQQIVSQHKGRFPQTPEKLRALPGIGPYTAAAIASLAFNQDFAVVDGNVIRVLSRLFAYPHDSRLASSKKWFQEQADALLPPGSAARFNEAMMELGATICLPRTPQCENCPLAPACTGKREGNPEHYPIKAPKAKVPHLIVGAAVVQDEQGNILVAQRRDGDMLGGLWEFPGGKKEEGETISECIVRELKEELDIKVKVGKLLRIIPHAYSHFTMEMHTYFARIQSGKPRPVECADFQWRPLETLRELPYSKADLLVIDALEKVEEKTSSDR